MEKHILEEINSKNNILEIVSEFVTLKKSGKGYKGLCPFHQEKTPSFSVSLDKNIAMCMGCREGGSPITFYSKIKGISIEKAANHLAERVGMSLKNSIKIDPFQSNYKMMQDSNDFFMFNRTNSVTGKAATDYLLKRGLTEESIAHFEIGLSPSSGDKLYNMLRDKGYDVNDMLSCGLVRQKEDGTYYDLMTQRITFPIKNSEGFVVGFSGRTLSKDESIKYLNSPESPIFKKSTLLYHLYEAQLSIRQNKTIILHEGFFDVIASYQAGFHYSVATMGTSLTKEHIAVLKKLSQYVIIAYDGDNAGFEATDKAIKLLEKESVKFHVAYFPQGLDPDEFLKQEGILAYQKLFNEQLKDPYDFKYVNYKQKTDFNVSHDRVKFKDNVLKMIEKSDISIQSLYRNKLSSDLGIHLEALVISSHKESLPFEDTNRLKKVVDKYFLAEVGIIIGLTQDKSLCEYVKTTLNHQHFSDNQMAMIRYNLFDYYERHDVFDEQIFLDHLKLEYRHVFELYIKTDIDYKNKFIKDSKTIDVFIGLIKESIQKRRLKKLSNDRKQKPENSAIYVGESIKIIKKLSGVDN